MAYQIIGTVYRIYPTENIQTKGGNQFQKRKLVLIQRRFDSNTGEELQQNFPALEFTGIKCQELDKYNVGDRVSISFDISGNKIVDEQTREEKFFSSLRAFSIKAYVQYQPQQPIPQPQPMPQTQTTQSPYPPQPPQYPPQQGYQPVQQPSYPPQPPQPYNELPF